MIWKGHSGTLLAWLRRLFILFLLLILLTQSTPSMREPIERIRVYTRQEEFEFLSWTLDALWVRLRQFSLGSSARLREQDRQRLVEEYFQELKEIQELERELAHFYANPDPSGNAPQADELRRALVEKRAHIARFQNLVEAILQNQVAAILRAENFGAGGKVFPPVAFRFSPLPVALIVSPREVIRQEANVQLNPNLTIDEQIVIEDEVAEALDVSTLIVPVGGVGSYPTMVLESTSVEWIVETVTHEWVHNYLTLRPLGLSYDTSPELRTMNETAASILGREIGRLILGQYYPQLAPQNEERAPPSSAEEPPAFDFRAEMHKTRIRVDQLLLEGEIEKAESYMEARRQVFWDHGYRIRKLNQAYFAFHGAYADQPGGAAGEDPVGAAVRELWDTINSPVQFLKTMAWMTSFKDLEQALARANP